MEVSSCQEDMHGDLLKWTSYLKGYCKRYFILENGVLSYYSDPTKVSDLCRGTINLRNACVKIPLKNRNHFIISVCGNRYYLKPKSSDDKRRWTIAFTHTMKKLKRLESLRCLTQDEDSDTPSMDIHYENGSKESHLSKDTLQIDTDFRRDNSSLEESPTKSKNDSLHAPLIRNSQSCSTSKIIRSESGALNKPVSAHENSWNEEHDLMNLKHQISSSSEQSFHSTKSFDVKSRNGISLLYDTFSPIDSPPQKYYYVVEKVDNEGRSSHHGSVFFSFKKLNCAIKKHQHNKSHSARNAPNSPKSSNSYIPSVELPEYEDLDHQPKANTNSKNHRRWIGKTSSYSEKDQRSTSEAKSKSTNKLHLSKSKLGIKNKKNKTNSQTSLNVKNQNSGTLQASDLTDSESLRLYLSRDISQLHEKESQIRNALQLLHLSIHDQISENSPSRTTNTSTETRLKPYQIEKNVTLIENSNESLLKKTSQVLDSWSDKIMSLQKRLSNEIRKNEHLERVIEQLAKQHRILESQLVITSRSGNLNMLKPTPNTDNNETPQNINNQLTEKMMRGSNLNLDSHNFWENIRLDYKNKLKRTGSVTTRPMLMRTKSSDSFVENGPWGHSIEDLFYDANSSLSGLPLHSAHSNGSIEAPSQSSRESLQDAQDLSDGSFSSFEEAIDIKENFVSKMRSQTNSRHDSIVGFSTNRIATSSVPVKKKRRTTIPAKPRVSLNLWSVLRSSVGKELSKIPLPVNFNEPLSFLQRSTEDLMYSTLLDNAAQFGSAGNYVMQMAYVAAFTISCYAATLNRTGKPFNPLLGETFECDRTDESEYGWRCICEQVSHHPPIMALHAESSKHGWQFRQDLTVTSKFRGKYLSVTPKGCFRLDFKDGSVITWNKITTCVHNIIVGKLWIDNYGEAYITNHTTGHSCEINYSPYSLLSNQNRSVKGIIKDSSGVDQYVITGAWDQNLEGYPFGPFLNNKMEAKVLWVAKPVRPDADQIYNFNDMSVELNELETGIAPTDSRLRPDQRLMEQGKWNEANEIKERLEHRQRSRRHCWDKGEYDVNEPYVPLWFTKSFDNQFNGECYLNNGQYWECKKSQNWSKCLDIFSVEKS